MSIDFSVVFWTIVNFSLLAVLLNKFLFKPVKSFMKDRQERIDSGIRAGVEAQQTEWDEAARIREEVLETARQEADETLAESHRGRDAAAKQLEQAEERIKLRRTEIKEDLHREHEALAAALQEKLPQITEEIESKFLAPLEDMGCGLSGLDRCVIHYAEVNGSSEDKTADGTPVREEARQDMPAAKLPPLSAAVVKKIVGAVE